MHGDMIALEPYLDLVVVVGALGIFGLSATEDPLGGVRSTEVDDLACCCADTLFKGAAPAKAACIDAEGRAACCVGAACPLLEVVGVAEKGGAECEAVDLAPPPSVGFRTHAFFEILAGTDKGILDRLVAICGEPKIRASKDRFNGGFEFMGDLKPPSVECVAHCGFVIVFHQLKLEGRKEGGCDAFGANAPVPFEQKVDVFSDLGRDSCAHLECFEGALEKVAAPKAVCIAL